MEEIIFCKSGGCTAKLAAGSLAKVLEKLPKKDDENLLVGFDSHDDGAVYKINEDQAIVTTLDFFPPMVNDPYLFGQIAATNALSDIYAMGGQVLSALNIVCFPEKMDLNILGKIMQGGADKVIEAGGVLCGGHSIVDTDIKYGLSVTGIVDPKHIYRNNTVKENDVIIMTKKLGTGIIMAANKVNLASSQAYQAATTSMTTLNKKTIETIQKYDIHAVSDITGFGLLVHLSEMLDQKFSFVLDSKKVGILESAYDYAKEFLITAAGQKNRNYLGDKVHFEIDDYALEEVFFDPQTAGGLLISVSKQDSEEIVKDLMDHGIDASVIGQVIHKNERLISVR